MERSPARQPLELLDLARDFGVQLWTASRVPNGDPTSRLAESTRARFLEVAANADYCPHRLARSLKLPRTHGLAMLIPDLANPFFSALFRAVEDVAGAAVPLPPLGRSIRR